MKTILLISNLLLISNEQILEGIKDKVTLVCYIVVLPLIIIISLLLISDFIKTRNKKRKE